MELEMESIKSQYLGKIDGLEKRLTQLVKDKHTLQAKLDVAILKFVSRHSV
jgi:hypothetical protein